MRTFLAAVLSVIAVGVLLIAYGLLAPRAIAAPIENGASPERVVYVTQPAPATHTVARSVARSVPIERRPARESRDWKKTALVVGGSTAAGAGIGGAFGGKTGALAGAAIGGGASALFEALHR